MFEADKACGVVESAFFLVAPPRGGLSVAPRDPDRCWKQFMMFFGGDSVCGDDSFAIFQSHPRARPGAGGVRTPSLGLRVQGASVPPFLLSCCCWRRRPPAARRSAARREEKKRLKATRGSESWSRDTGQQTRGRVIISVGIPARAMGFPGKGTRTRTNTIPYGTKANAAG